jgi:hypothetical protein
MLVAAQVIGVAFMLTCTAIVLSAAWRLRRRRREEWWREDRAESFWP